MLLRRGSSDVACRLNENRARIAGSLGEDGKKADSSMSPVESHTKMRNVIKIQQVWSRPWVQVTLVSKAAGAEWKTLSDKAAAGFCRWIRGSASGK